MARAGRRESSAQAAAHVALLRGINVGGKNPLPMKELAAMVEAAGASDVRTYIQSGNVIFRASPAIARGVAAAVSAAIAGRFGFTAPVVTRSAAELEAIAESNPFLGRGADPATLHVVFLADEPAPERVAALDPRRSPPDELEVRGREIFLRCPNGYARTKLTNAYFDSKLATTSTVRNWRTVLQLVELAQKAT
jgi:uncharacterized protein (DUF1697 family)